MTFEMILEEKKEEGFAQGIERGIEQGAYNKSLETAKKLLVKNIAPTEISDITDLPLEVIMKLEDKV